jgi:hypothetical protein
LGSAERSLLSVLLQGPFYSEERGFRDNIDISYLVYILNMICG